MEDAVPNPIVKEMVKLIHGSGLVLEDLIDHVHKSLTSTFLPGDKVHFKFNYEGRAAAGEVIGKSRCLLMLTDISSSKRNVNECGISSSSKPTIATFDVRLCARNTIIQSVLFQDLIRCTPIPSKDHLQCFVNANAKLVSHRWIVNPDFIPAHVSPVGPRLKSAASDDPSKPVSIPDKIEKPKKKKISEEEALRTAKPLPMPKEIYSSSGLLGSVAGDCFFIAEFIGCHTGILRSSADADLFPLTAEHLLTMFALGPHGFTYLNSLIICLLRIVIKDENNPEPIKVLKMDFSELPITVYSASEVAGLLLENAPLPEKEAIYEALIALKKQDISQLDAVQKAQVFVAICHFVLDSNAIISYRSRRIREAAVARHEMCGMKIMDKGQELDKENIEKDKDTVVPSAAESAKSDLSVSTNEFYGSVVVENAKKLGRVEAIKAVKEKRMHDKLRRAEQTAIMKQQKWLAKRQNLVNMKNMLIRINPIGIDRHGSRYWNLTHSGYGLLVEQTIEEDHANRIDGDNSTNLRNLPMTRWYHYDSGDQIQSLRKALCKDLSSENQLIARLLKHSTTFSDGQCLHARRSSIKVETRNGIEESIETLREEMTYLEDNLFSGSLALIPDRDQWMKNLTDAQSYLQFASCLLDVYLNIPLNILCGSLWTGNFEGATKVNVASAAAKDIFAKEVCGASSMSRLHLLLTILSSCVQWSLESKLRKCQICHTVNKEFLVTCGFCKTVVHANCTSPPLTKLPRFQYWFCSSPCQKHYGAHHVQRKINLSAMEKRILEFGFKIPVCCKSKSRTKQQDPDDLIACSTCSKVYHKKCHVPPLRNTPRGDWNCSKCASRKK